MRSLVTCVVEAEPFSVRLCLSTNASCARISMRIFTRDEQLGFLRGTENR